MKNQRTAAKTQARVKPSKANKDFVIQSCANLAEAGYGFVHEVSDSLRHLYLISGEIYRLGESDLTRIR